MIYQTGTITTTAGQTKIKGTGTRWKDNLAGISEGCPISYLVNNTVFMNTVLSVNSDTEINLTYPVPVAASAAKYQIATFVLDSMSDGVRKMLANQQYIQYFLRNMDTWLTQDGIVEIKTPTGEVIHLESIRSLKSLIDNKLDSSALEDYALKTALEDYALKTALEDYALKTALEDYAKINDVNTALGEKLSLTGGTISKNGEALTIKAVSDNQAIFLKFRDSSGRDLGYFGKPNDTDRISFVNSVAGTALTLTEDGRLTYKNKDVMLVGDYGWGGSGDIVNMNESQLYAHFKTQPPSKIFRNDAATGPVHFQYCPIIYARSYSLYTSLSASAYGSGVKIIGGDGNNNHVYNVYTDKNTTKDAQGNLRAASPVVKVFTDHIELNDESTGVELEKLSTGSYKLKGTLGMNSDASWGGIHGGLVVPNGINSLPLVWADFDVLPDGDIIIETRYRKHTLHPRLEAQRLMTYPEFLDENNVEREDYDYCDIPNGHWIDVRVNMPSDSIYNQKLAEAERLAKIEAERVVKEEAEKAAREEAERLDDESKQEQASKLEG